MNNATLTQYSPLDVPAVEHDNALDYMPHNTRPLDDESPSLDGYSVEALAVEYITY